MWVRADLKKLKYKKHKIHKYFGRLPKLLQGLICFKHFNIKQGVHISI